MILMLNLEKTSYWQLLLAGGMLLVLAACATTPAPRIELEQAQAQIEAADHAGAVDYAPFEISSAKEHMTQARRALDRSDNQRANELLERAMADARLAQLRARLEDTRMQTNLQKEENEKLQRELDHGPGSVGADNAGLPEELVLPEPKNTESESDADGDAS